MDLQNRDDLKTILIGLVGPCVSGKTTISTILRELGYRAKVIAQEHSYVPNMWQIITKPQFLVFLEVSYQKTLVRLHMNWTEQEYREQLSRLGHAKENADLIIFTDDLNPQEICSQIISYINTYLSRNTR